MKRIAIVDDSLDNLEIMAYLLDGLCVVEQFPNGKAFLEHFEPGRYDVVILDIVMPQMDGYSVYDRIRQRDQSVPVIAVTACVSENEKCRAEEIGFSDYLCKPILDFDSFRSIIGSRIGNATADRARNRA